MPNTNSSSDADDTQNNLVILLDHPEYEYVEIELIPTDNVPAQTTLTAAQLAAFLLALVLMGNPDEWRLTLNLHFSETVPYSHP